MTHRTASAALILILASGCDNVAWGGIDYAVQRPPDREGEAEPDSTPASPEAIPLPTGPVLYSLTRSGDSALVRPVAEVGPGGLVPLPAADTAADYWESFRGSLVPPGGAMGVYARGRVGGGRVGEAILGPSARVDESLCAERPALDALLQVVPSAGEARHFLSLGQEDPLGLRAIPAETIRPTNRHEAISRSIMGQVLPQVGARWPSSLDAARADLQLFRLDGRADTLVAATFIFRDQLAVRPAQTEAYAIFFIGEPAAEGGYAPWYVWYRPADRDGKGIPLFRGNLDWDGDGADEILLEVLGSDAGWYAALDRTGGEWRLVFEEECGTAAVRGTGGETDSGSDDSPQASELDSESSS